MPALVAPLDATRWERAAGTVGLLLAAGAGCRFDAAHPGRKLEVLLDGVAVAERALSTLVASTDAVVLVARSHDAPIAKAARSQQTVVVCAPAADGAQTGMGESLARGALVAQQRFAAVHTVVVALADMPWLRAVTVHTLIAQSRERDAIVQPLYGGHRGHPVVFPARYLNELIACRGDVGARQVLQKNAQNVYALAVDDAGVTRDVDLPQDVLAPPSGA